MLSILTTPETGYKAALSSMYLLSAPDWKALLDCLS